MSDESPLACQADQFHLPPGVRYLNCAYGAPLLRSVEQAAHAALARWRTPQNLGPEAYFDEAEQVRTLFARLIGAEDGERIALVPSVSYGIAIAARNVAAKPGTNVVIADGQFPSNVYTWRRLCQHHGAELRMVPRPSDGSWTERLLAAMDPHTVAVALGTLDWVDGTRFDLEAIGSRARDVGAIYVLDGIQSVGALPFDVGQVRPDLLVCASYKWLLGPMGLGVCYIGDRLADGEALEETWLGRSGSENFSALTEYTDHYQPGARRFDAGGRAHFVLLPMLAAALGQLLAWGPDRIQAYCAALVRPTLAELAGLELLSSGPDPQARHLFSVRLPPNVPAEIVRETLAHHQLQVSLRQGKLRISPNVYNTAADIDALVACLRTLRNLMPSESRVGRRRTAMGGGR